MSLMSQNEALELAKRFNIPLHEDFKKLVDLRGINLAIKERGYVSHKDPKNPQNLFYAYLCRSALGKKWKTERVLQGNYGRGWEDLCSAQTRREILKDLKAHRQNEGGLYRIVTRQTKLRD